MLYSLPGRVSYAEDAEAAPDTRGLTRIYTEDGNTKILWSVKEVALCLCGISASLSIQDITNILDFTFYNEIEVYTYLCL
jgi:hypothetical protein